MGYRLVFIVLVGVAALFGGILGSFPTGRAEPSAPQSDASARNQSEVVEQLKEISAQLKELNAMFRSGRARVVVVLNPDVGAEKSR